MAYTLITAPQADPVSLAEAKAHLRVDVDDENTLIAALITAARQYAEQITGRSLVNQQWLYTADSFPGAGAGSMGVVWGAEYSQPGNAMLLEKGPVQSIDSIKYLDMTGAQQTLAPSVYTYDLATPLARVTPRFGQVWPLALPQIGAVQVAFTAGYGVDGSKVPQGIKQWMLLRIGALYENREEEITGRSVTVAPLSFVDSLLDPYRIWRV